MRGDADDAVAAGAHALFFPYGLGHMLGMDVHDMENLGEDIVGYGPGLRAQHAVRPELLRLARPLEPGFVLTVEPGLYFIPTLIDAGRPSGRTRRSSTSTKIDKFRNARGYRIEDDVLVTPRAREDGAADSEDRRGCGSGLPVSSRALVLALVSARYLLNQSSVRCHASFAAASS